MSARTRTLARYATVAAIVLVVGGIFIVRDVMPRLAGTSQYGVLDGPSRVEIGYAAPDFLLQEATTGREVRLSDYRGRTVVLNFWATWCGPCRYEMPEFQRAYLEGGEDTGDVVILAVDYRESDALVAAFRDELGLTFPLLMDRDGTVRTHYGAQGLPATYFIDAAGVLRSMSLGPVVGDRLAEGLREAGAP